MIINLVKAGYSTLRYTHKHEEKISIDCRPECWKCTQSCFKLSGLSRRNAFPQNRSNDLRQLRIKIVLYVLEGPHPGKLLRVSLLHPLHVADIRVHHLGMVVLNLLFSQGKKLACLGVKISCSESSHLHPCCYLV